MVTVETLKKGLISCFPQGTRDERGKLVHAEVSAVVFDGEQLLMASDKPIPGAGRSSVFAVDYDQDQGPRDSTLRYIDTPAIRGAAKYEDFALTPDGNYIIATTGFDRVAEASAELDAYNSLVLWPKGRPEEAHVVASWHRGEAPSSVALRKHLLQVIGRPYYKIEGLAAVPRKDADDLLLFGVREQGEHHADFDYCSDIIAVPYRIDGGELIFTGEFRRAYSFVPHEVERVLHTCGLSSLEYDPYSGDLYILTSFESEDSAGNPEIGGYLWITTLEDLVLGARPHLVTHNDGEPVVFANKAEGLAVVRPDRLLVVFDNDRHLGLEGDRGRETRTPNEAPYTLMSVQRLPG